MRVINNYGEELIGINEYLNYLSIGNTSNLKVEINKANKDKWHGKAYFNLIQIWLPSELTYPYKIVDKYMGRYKRLAALKENPRIANNVNELCGFIFLHELKHTKYYKSKRYGGSDARAGMQVERYCTEFAYENFKPMLPEHEQLAQKLVEESRNKVRLIAETQQKNIQFNASPQGKIEKIDAALKRWNTKKKRAETAIKKLNRRKKLWENKVINNVC